MNKSKYIGILGVAVLLVADPVCLFAMADHGEALDTLKETPTHISGKIVFQSDRDGALSEIWMIQDGRQKKLITSAKTAKDLPKEISVMFGNILADLKNPKWSPDGSKFLCVANEEIVIYKDSGELVEKIKPKMGVLRAQWSPKGDIYYTSVNFLPEGGGAANIFKINMTDKAESRVTNLSPLPGVKRILNFDVHPGDKTIAMQIWGEEEYGISIWTINTDGTDLKLLVKYAGDPAWSPDGKKLAYVARNLPSGEKIEFLDVFVLDIVTGETNRITNNKWEEHGPVFSPDGKQIAYSSARHKVISHGAEIFVINLDGTSEERLTLPQPNPKLPNDPVRGWATDEYPDWAE